jgi:hypothetical protein
LVKWRRFRLAQTSPKPKIPKPSVHIARFDKTLEPFKFLLHDWSPFYPTTSYPSVAHTGHEIFRSREANFFRNRVWEVLGQELSLPRIGTGVTMSDLTQWNEMSAREAVASLLEHTKNYPLHIGELYSREEILAWINVYGPDRSRGPAKIHENFKCWRDAKVLPTFISRFQKETGLYLETVPGAGFRVLPPEENVPVANEMVYKRVTTALKKGLHILKHTRDEDLTEEEKQEKRASHVCLGGFKSVFESEMAQRARKEQAPEPPQVGTTPVSSPQPCSAFDFDNF